MRTFTELVGTTDSTSPSTYGGAFTTLANNNSAQAVATAKSLVNNQHRYLLQKYFDNERTVTITTVGGQSLTLTAIVTVGSTSATLTSAWTYPTCTQIVNFSGSQSREVLFTLNSTAITWANGLLTQATTAISTVGVQNYSIPADVSKIKNDTINVGQLKYQPTFIESIQDWDLINFLPYTSDIPNYCFIYNGTMRIFPIPSTTGNIITFNYKTRVADMTYSDYSVGTLATMTAGSTTVTGTSTLWSVYPQSVNLQYQNLYLRADPATGGDGIWYPILKFNSATSLTLALPCVNAPNVTSSTTYTIGQAPLLSEDFHDMIVYGALKIYFSTIVDNPEKFKEYDALYKERKEMLDDYAGTKQVNVDLGDTPQQVNPNLFIYSN